MPTMPNNANVKVLRAAVELETIREVWESWPGNRDSQMDSYLKFIESNRATVRPHVVVVEREGRPDAILVGRIDLGHISCRLGYWQLKLPAKILYFVYGALRGNPSVENCNLILSSVLQSLSDREGDFAYLNFLRQESDLCGLALKRPGLLSRDYVRLTQLHFAASLPPTVAEYYQSLPSESKGFNKARHKKLLRDFAGRLSIKCFREAAEIDDMARDIEQVAKTSYQRGLGVGFRDGPETREALRMMARNGWLRAYVLYLAERPCAFWIGDINQSTFGSDYIAFDSEFGKYSPGMFLTTKVIEGFCDGNSEGVTAVDFGPGHAQYKEILSNQRWLETAVYIFAPSVKGFCLNASRSIVEGTDKAIKKVLAHTNLLPRIKKAWREHARAKEAVQAGA